MKPIPDGIVDIVLSARLRAKISELEKLIAPGPVGIQKWGQPVSMVLMSRDYWDALMEERVVDQG